MIQFNPEQPEWITWSGGERPVKAYQQVEIKCRDGSIKTGSAEMFFWGRLSNQSRYDIIAYRVVTPYPVNNLDQARFIEVHAGVRYWEDGTLNGVQDDDGKMPLRQGEDWCPTIELETGRVLDWPTGLEADVHYKVCDDGFYWLLNANRKRLAMKEGYVPRFLAVGTNGYGDYIIFKIGGDGLIPGWKRPELNPDGWSEGDA